METLYFGLVDENSFLSKPYAESQCNIYLCKVALSFLKITADILLNLGGRSAFHRVIYWHAIFIQPENNSFPGKLYILRTYCI